MLRENADRDPYLRHAGVMGLLGSKAMEAVAAHAGDPSPSVRLAVLLVERRMADPRVAEFLDDADPRLAAEAARAINDVPIEAAMPRLADRLGRLRSDDAAPLVRRDPRRVPSRLDPRRGARGSPRRRRPTAGSPARRGTPGPRRLVVATASRPGQRLLATAFPA
ncbi:MAG: hypothetical protein U0794_04120 [Isosphaeraceae bacterium]